MNKRNSERGPNQSKEDFDYLKKGFYDAEENIRKELLDENAEKIAEKLNNQKLTSTQLRRFYHDAKTIQRRIEVEGNNEKIFKKYLPEIKMIKAKAAYASNPQQKKIPVAFKNFITQGIDNIKDYKDFKAFMKHFEAVLGYFYGLG